MEQIKGILSRYWRIGIVIFIGIIIIVYIALGFLFLQQGGLQRDTELKIAQIKPILSKEMPSRAALQAEYDAVLESLKPITSSEAIIILVDMARENGIDVSEEARKFVIPVAGHGSIRIGDATYDALNFNSIRIQGAPDDVMNFLNDIQTGKNIETMKLTNMSVSELLVPYTGEEAERRTEFSQVILAVEDIMTDNDLQSIPNPISYSRGIASNTMGDNPDTDVIIEGFPDNTTTPLEKGYTGNATIKSGYLLYGHDKPNPNNPTEFTSKNYFSKDTTIYFYTCESDGKVRQWSGPDVSSAIEYFGTESSRVELNVVISLQIYYRANK